MGWRERDYAKFTKDEWDALLGRRSQTSGSTRGPSEPSPPSSRRSFLNRPIGWPTIIVGLLVAAVYMWSNGTFDHWRDRLASPTPAVKSSPLVTQSAPPIVQRAPAVVTPAVDAKAVRIRWRATDVAPAPTAGRICVNSHGRICAAYVEGERPADALARRIRSLGLHVESG